MKISDTVVGEADPRRASWSNLAAIRVGTPTNQRSWRPPEKADDDEALKWISQWENTETKRRSLRFSIAMLRR